MWLRRSHTPRYTWRGNNYRFAPFCCLLLSLKINHRQSIVITPTAAAQPSLHSEAVAAVRRRRMARSVGGGGGGPGNGYGGGFGDVTAGLGEGTYGARPLALADEHADDKWVDAHRDPRTAALVTQHGHTCPPRLAQRQSSLTHTPQATGRVDERNESKQRDTCEQRPNAPDAPTLSATRCAAAHCREPSTGCRRLTVMTPTHTPCPIARTTERDNAASGDLGQHIAAQGERSNTRSVPRRSTYR